MSARKSPESWLFVDGAREFGGHEVMLIRLVNELADRAEVRPWVLSRAGSRLREATAVFSAVEDLPAETWLRRWRDAWCFVRVVRHHRPRLCVVAEGCLLAQFGFAVLARLLRLPLFVYVPLVDETRRLGFRSGPLRDAVVRMCYANLPHGWITITAEQAQQFAAWAGVRKPILTLPNTVAKRLEQIAATGDGQADPDHELLHRRLRVLVLGRLEDHQKGLRALVDFLARQEVLRRQVQVSLVGSGPLEAELRSRIEGSAALAECVSLQPWSNPVDVMTRHDVLLIASRYEGVPLVMLEAMALGLPVVSSNLPGTRAFLPRDCLFPVGDLACAFRIVTSLRDPDFLRRVVAENRATFAQRASTAAFSSAVNALAIELHRLAAA